MSSRAEIQLAGALKSVAVEPAAPGFRAHGAPGEPLAPADAHVLAQLEPARRQLEEQRRQLAQAAQALLSGARQLQELQAAALAEAEQQLVDLAVEIARKVLMQEVQAGRYEIDPILSEAMRHVPSRHDVVVRLHPDDYAQCRMARELAEDCESIRFVADPNVRRAQCIVESKEGVVDSSVESNLACAAQALKDAE